MVDLVSQLQDFEQTRARPKAILVDFFDTVVSRTVEPEYVKAIWAKRLRYHAGITMSASDIYAARLSAESHLTSQNVAAGFDDDFRYLEMARAVLSAVKASEGVPLWCTEAVFLELCERTEIDIEKQSQFLNPEAVQLLEYCNQHGIPTYLVSDTFLTMRQVRELLSFWGIQQLFRRIFLSSDYLVAKRTGKLYDHVRAALELEGADILMVGDNPHSDILKARERGLFALQADQPFSSVPRRTTKDSQRLVKESLTPSDGCAENVFSELATSMLLFTAELFRRARSVGAKDLLFCSREGLLLKDFFDRYQRAMTFYPPIRTHYFYTSRVASFLPGLNPLRLETFDRLFRQYKSLSLAMFLKNLQCDERVIERVAAEIGCESDRTERDFPSSDTFKKLKRSSYFAEYYNRTRVDQRILTREYIASFFADSTIPETVAIVDVGWRGTIQDNLHALLEPNHRIEGLYVGLIAPALRSATNRKSGLLFSNDPTPSPFFSVFAETRALFEIILSASHPGVLRYERSSQGVVPVFDSHAKQDDVQRVIRQIQVQLVERFEKALDIWVPNHLDEAGHLEGIARMHARIGLAPSEAELELVASVNHVENFGALGTTSFAIPGRVGWGKSLRNYLRYLRDPSSILDSTLWPALSLHREGLRHLVSGYAKRRNREIFGA